MGKAHTRKMKGKDPEVFGRKLQSPSQEVRETDRKGQQMFSWGVPGLRFARQRGQIEERDPGKQRAAEVRGERAQGRGVVSDPELNDSVFCWVNRGVQFLWGSLTMLLETKSLLKDPQPCL